MNLWTQVLNRIKIMARFFRCRASVSFAA